MRLVSPHSFALLAALSMLAVPKFVCAEEAVTAQPGAVDELPTSSGPVVAGAPTAPQNVVPTHNATGVATSAELRVQVSDPDAQTLTVTFYGRSATGGDSGADFTLIGLPDTQFYVSNLNGGKNAIFRSQTQWIVANTASRNIVDLIHLGDCVQNGDNGGNTIEWLRADTAMKAIENPVTTGLANGIPYGVCVGNHDQSPSGSSTGTTNFYNQFFGVGRFGSRPYYGGHYGSNNDNHWHTFSAGGMDFIVIMMEYDSTPETAVLDWADNLLKTHPNHRGIVVSHYLINTGNPASFGAQGQATYDALKDNPNLDLMLSGHVAGEGRRVDTFNGHTTHTILTDYQGRSNGGDGWLRIYEFSPAKDVIRARTFSPWRNQFETDADSSSQFTLPYDMPGVAPFLALGAATVPANTTNQILTSGTAGITWPNLVSTTAYEWYVTVSDNATTVTSPTWRFTTADGQPPTVTLNAPNGGQNYVAGSTQSLAWSATDNVGVTAIDLDYSIDGGATYPNPIASNLANAGTYAWSVPVDFGTQIRVRVTARDAAGNSASDASEANLAIVTEPPPSTNLCGNPDFEIDTHGWAGFGSATLSRASGGRSGSALQVQSPSSTSTFGGDDNPNWITTVAGLGRVYRLSAWVQSSVSRGAVRLRVLEYAGTSQVGSTASSSTKTLGSSWQQLTMDYTVRQAGTTLSLRVSDAPAASGEAFLIDDVSVELLDGTPVDHAPVVTAPATAIVNPGTPLTLNIAASDPDGDAIASLGAANVPTGATFSAASDHKSATLTWTPTAADVSAAPYTVTFTATNLLSGSAATAITVATAPPPATNLCSNPGFEDDLAGWIAYSSATLSRISGGHSGGFAMKIQSPVSTSSFGCDDQPNCVPLVAGLGRVYRISAWVRSDASRGPVKIRVYEFAGSSQVGSTAYSNQPSLSATWQQLTIDYPVRQAGTALSIRITDAPVVTSESFLVDDVSVTLLPVAAASPLASAHADAADAPLVFAARVVPQPISGAGVLELSTTREGHARVDLYDAQGRRMRTLLDTPIIAAGRHRFEIEGNGRERLGAGVFFYRVVAAEGERRGRFVVVE